MLGQLLVRLHSPVCHQLHLKLCARLCRVGAVQPDERVRPMIDLDLVARATLCGDHLVDGGWEVCSALPVCEEVHVFARALQDPVRGDGMAAGQREPVWPPALSPISASRRWTAASSALTRRLAAASKLERWSR